MRNPRTKSILCSGWRSISSKAEPQAAAALNMRLDEQLPLWAISVAIWILPREWQKHNKGKLESAKSGANCAIGLCTIGS